jgi:FkbM family methyltransferase
MTTKPVTADANAAVGESAESLLRRLVRQRFLHHLIRVFRIQALVRLALTVRPVVRRLPRTGIQYRIRHLESLVMADEIFRANCYAAAFEGRDVKTFIDAGCNVGFFACYAAEQAGGRDIIGLMVDASPDMVEESRWHISANGLTRVRAVQGAIGFPADVHEVTFFMAASNVASSAQPRQNPRVPAKGDLVESRVPTIQLIDAWRQHAGDAAIDLLKLDVEGSEIDAIRTNGALLKITRAVVLEWHKWVVTIDQVTTTLAEHGFQLERVISEDEDAGLAFFVRASGV